MKSITVRSAALVVVALLLNACAAIGLQVKTFEDRVAVAYTTATYVRETAEQLLTADTITADDAENINAQVDHFRAAIEVARSIHATDPSTGADKLAAALVGLNALADYLRARP